MAHILVIDNDRSVGASIQLMLEHGGHSSAFAADAQTGLDALDTSGFDLAFVDMLMPGIDGLETIRRMRDKKPVMPIVAMSGFRLRNAASQAADMLETATRLGAAYCLRKPFSQEELLTVANLSSRPQATALLSNAR